jgi:hypothetical protein
MTVAEDARHGLKTAGGNGEPQRGETAEEPRQGDGPLGPGQRRPQAEVNAVPEREV